MAENKNDHVVIALFDSEDFANYGINLLKKWDNATDDIKLGAIGTISMKDGKVKTQAPHKTGGGAKVGAVLGMVAAVLTGGTSWIVGAMGGSALGAISGAFFKKSLHLTKQEIEALGKQLEAGKVAVVVTCDEHEVEETGKHLTMYGGVLTTYMVPEGALTEAADALAATAAATEESLEATPESTPEATLDVTSQGASETAPEAIEEEQETSTSTNGSVP